MKSKTIVTCFLLSIAGSYLAAWDYPQSTWWAEPTFAWGLVMAVLGGILGIAGIATRTQDGR
jgi:hypothetical protein